MARLPAPVAVFPPTHTTARELERAKQLGSVTALLAEKQTTKDTWRRNPRFKKGSGSSCCASVRGGFILLRFAWDWRNMALGAAMLGIAFFVSGLVDNVALRIPVELTGCSGGM